MTEPSEKASTGGSVEFLNPGDLPKNPAYTNVIVVSGSVKTIYIGAQGAFDAATGTIVGTITISMARAAFGLKYCALLTCTEPICSGTGREFKQN